MTQLEEVPAGLGREQRVQKVLVHYEEPTDDETIAEDEAALVESRQEVNVTDLLKRAFDAASRLPEDEQDAVAEWLLAELYSEEEWEGRFARTQDALSKLAREALTEHERGETEDLDPNSL